jgi:hypothetical protein
MSPYSKETIPVFYPVDRSSILLRNISVYLLKLWKIWHCCENVRCPNIDLLSEEFEK